MNSRHLAIAFKILLSVVIEMLVCVTEEGQLQRSFYSSSANLSTAWFPEYKYRFSVYSTLLNIQSCSGKSHLVLRLTVLGVGKNGQPCSSGFLWGRGLFSGTKETIVLCDNNYNSLQ